MLEERVQQASQASARSRQRMMWIFGVSLIVAAGAILLFLQQAAPPARPVQTPSERTVSERTVSEQTVSAPAKQPANLTDNDQTALRNRFMAHLQTYQSGLEAGLAGANLKQWHAQQAVALTTLTQDVISAFSAGDYATALEKLAALTAMAKQTLATRDARLVDEITAVKQALAADNAVAATLHITKALQLKPDNPQLQPLVEQVQTLPALLALLKKANIAHTENNPAQELVWLKQAANIALYRNGLAERRDALAEKMRTTQFSQLISAGLTAVKQKNISAARQNYKTASALSPGRSELRLLGAAINKLSDTLALQRALTQAETASARDDWRRAKKVYAAAARKFPNNRDIHDGLQLADRLVALQTAVLTYLRQAERLSARNVSGAAQGTLIQARALAHHSPSLARNTAQLQGLLDVMNIKIPVLVTSDNHTFIRVRGVGKVGITLARTIQLRPGEYTFEGIRAGYKSKLVRVRLPAGVKSLNVEVVCDEPI